MKYLTLTAFALTSLGSIFPSSAQNPQQEIADKSQQARSILDAWKMGAPTDAKRTLHIIYWTPSDREPAPQYRERLTRVMTHIQAFYITEMKRLGFGPRTINLDIADDKLLRIHLVKAPHPYTNYHVNDGKKIRNECLPVIEKAGIDASRETILIFCNMSNWNPATKRLTQNSPYYANGKHSQGTAWQVDSPLLDPIHLDKKQPKIQDGQYGNISLGKYNSIFVGGVAHELGHALGLPHNCERADEHASFGTALMGSGNFTYFCELRGEGKGSFLTLASGLRLASHPMFSGSVKGMHSRGVAKLTNINFASGDKKFTLTGKVEAAPGSPPVYAVIAYCDPSGGSNYDATTATAVPDKNGHFSLHCNSLQAGKPATLRLIALYANGDATSHIGSYSPYSYPYWVDKNGQPDLSTIQLTKIFSPVQQATRANNKKESQYLLAEIIASKNPKAVNIAKRLLTQQPIHGVPASLNLSLNKVALSDTTPSFAKVGYFRPVYNRIPPDNGILLSSSRVFEHGIYAHAPARHTYQLGGKWKTLSGQCALAQQAAGSILFIIKADGEELWRSPLIRAGRVQPYEIDISNKHNLELIVEDGGDGSGSDWALWLEPNLSR